ncbi:transcriptional regulator [Aquipseudomonas alcaligenes]|uniref:Transcriptional regulator n=1 Tax=Aquipseudomonas alcaligenes TaxID=43263 RepID=A0A2V4LGN1_AQUAC|nr:histone-like nucleoid-structuring protein, MvaT/MvaU family [Pseudomonas alcaligenes]PYC20217.1 transcriptional regulator [Pseudomonas alcaligenes]
MSKLAQFKALEAQLAAQLEQLEAMKKDEGLKREVEFEEKLRALMGEYKMNLGGIIAILDPAAAAAKPLTSTDKRKERATKVYKNPQTGEVVQTKGGNHKALKQWKEQFGADVVETWLQ